MPNSLDLALHTIVRDPDLHARWLNTFSLLEYIGFRKIVKSQSPQVIDGERLTHAIEEGRHALLLKKLAIKTGGPKFETYAHLLCGEEAAAYFHSLDHQCLALLHKDFPQETGAHLNYLYVTWLVEVRALAVYRSYVAALAPLGQASPLKSLLAEEDHHLEGVTAALAQADARFTTHRKPLEKLEASLYKRYLEALVRTVAAEKRHDDQAAV